MKTAGAFSYKDFTTMRLTIADFGNQGHGQPYVISSIDERSAIPLSHVVESRKISIHVEIRRWPVIE